MKSEEINFSIVIIAKNEAKNIPVMAKSAKEYLEAGGEICLLDTGSEDDTVNVAKELGFNVIISEEKFFKTLIRKDYYKWKRKNDIKSEPVEKLPISFFSFDDARNAAAKIAKNDMIFFMDGCDHFVKFNFKEINRLIKEEDYENFFTLQLYSGARGHINRFYNRKKGSWVGYTHEYIRLEGNLKQKELPEDILTIQHNPGEKERRYMIGLILTHYKMEDSRWNYYLGREFFNKGNSILTEYVIKKKKKTQLKIPERR